MKFSGVLAALTLMAASEAHALSCAQPRIENSFQWWSDAEEVYYIGVGSLILVGELPRIPGTRELSNGAERLEWRADYRFEGYLLDGGDNVPYEGPVTVEVDCVSPWCGGFPASGRSGLMAFEVDGPFDLTLSIGACPGAIFDASVEETVQACLRAGRCPETE